MQIIKHLHFTDGVPTDGSHVRVLDATHIASFIVSVVLYGALFTFAMGCLLFNVLFPKTEGTNITCTVLILFFQFRVVKLTSPILNCVMIAGALFLGLAFVLYHYSDTLNRYPSSSLYCESNVPAQICMLHITCMQLVHRMYHCTEPNQCSCAWS